MAIHIVKQGECIESIAYANEFFWQTVWEHPDNASLKEKRKDPNTLMPGDKVFIPKKTTKWVTIQTGSTHKFTKKGVPSRLRVKLTNEDGESLAGVVYTLNIKGKEISGTTDTNGWLDETIFPDVDKVTALIGEEEKYEYEFQVGHLDPIDEISGIKARLQNLGYDIEEIDNKKNPELSEEIKEFQTDHNLEPTGEIDDNTLQKLKEIHGC